MCGGFDTVGNQGLALQQLENAIRGNTVLHSLYIKAISTTDMLPLLEFLHLLAPLQHLAICTIGRGNSCAATARAISKLLSPTDGAAGNLRSLSFEKTNFIGDFGLAWTAVRKSTVLRKVAFLKCTFDAINVEAFEDCFQNLESGDEVDLMVDKCNFEGTKSGKVAAGILVARKLKSLHFGVYPIRGLGDIGFIEMMDDLEAQSQVRARLPRLKLDFFDAESANVLKDALPKLTNLRDLSIVFFHPITYTLAAELKAGLAAATKANGSLHFIDFDGRLISVTKDRKHYVERNKHVPTLLEHTRQDDKLRLLLPKLFAAALQAPRLASSTIVAALVKRKRVGPSEAAAAARMRAAAANAFAIEAASFANIVSASEMAISELATAQTTANVATEKAAAAEAAVATAVEDLIVFRQTPEDMSSPAAAAAARALAAAAMASSHAATQEAEAIAALGAATEDVATKKAKVAIETGPFLAVATAYMTSN